MARTDTLGNFLTDVASAIKEKKGSADAISADTFDDEIRNLPSGESIDNIDGAIFYGYRSGNDLGYTENELAEGLKNFNKIPRKNFNHVFDSCYFSTLQRKQALYDSIDFSKCVTAKYCFNDVKHHGTSQQPYIILRNILKNWDNNHQVSDMSYAFQNLKEYRDSDMRSQIYLDFNNVDLSNVQIGSYMFYNTYNSSYKTPGIRNTEFNNFTPPVKCNYLFAYAGYSSNYDPKVITFSKVTGTPTEHAKFKNVSHVTDFSSAFQNVMLGLEYDYQTSWLSIDWSNVDLSSCTSMRSMFYCSYELSNSSYDFKSINFSNMIAPLCTDYAMMFNYRTNLETCLFTNAIVNADCNLQSMFYRCPKLTTLDISCFNLPSNSTKYTVLGTPTTNRNNYYVPANCNITVKDQTSYNTLLSMYPWLTNVHIKES